MRKWIARLEDKLQRKQPTPVVAPPEVEGGQQTRIELTIVDYDIAAHGQSGAQ